MIVLDKFVVISNIIFCDSLTIFVAKIFPPPPHFLGIKEGSGVFLNILALGVRKSNFWNDSLYCRERMYENAYLYDPRIQRVFLVDDGEGTGGGFLADDETSGLAP